jgi:ubiquinone/menaquinone biosynthesis C-methylase UbiE
MSLTGNSSAQKLSGKDSFFSVKFADPQSIIDQLEINLGMVVADFGCGGGFFSLPLAKKVGEKGRVYALDILKDKLESVESQAKVQGLTNIIPKRVNLEVLGGSKLETESVDWVIMKDMLFQNQGKEKILAEAKRVLKTGGRALIIEWDVNDLSIGPEKSLRVFKENLLELAKEGGWGMEKEIEVGNFHYSLVLRK